MSIWDHKVKKRLRQYPRFPGPVAAVAFNCDGTKVAVGVSYTWDEGEKGLKTNAIPPWLGVRKVGDEVKVCSVVCPLFFSPSPSPHFIGKFVSNLDYGVDDTGSWFLHSTFTFL